jgi:hypothetical protein
VSRFKLPRVRDFTGHQLVTALILLYIDIGALAGFLIERHHHGATDCWPYVSVFGVLETECTNALMGWVWFFLVGLPRVLIMLPALGLSMIEAGIKSGPVFGTYYAFASITWLLYSIPLFAIVWAAISSWRTLSVPVVTLLVLILTIEIAHLAELE